MLHIQYRNSSEVRWPLFESGYWGTPQPEVSRPPNLGGFFRNGRVLVTRPLFIRPNVGSGLNSDARRKSTTPQAFDYGVIPTQLRSRSEP